MIYECLWILLDAIKADSLSANRLTKTKSYITIPSIFPFIDPQYKLYLADKERIFGFASLA